MSSLREFPTTLARSIMMNALTRLVSGSAEAANINVAIAAVFAKPNRIIVKCKHQQTTTRSCTSAQANSSNEREISECCKPMMLRLDSAAVS